MQLQQEKDIYDTTDHAYNNKFSAVELNINMPIFSQRFDTNERKKVKNMPRKRIELTFHAPEDISLLQLQKGKEKLNSA